MKIIKILGIAVGASAALFAAALAVKNPGNVAETAENANDKSLSTRHYNTPEDIAATVEKIKSIASEQTTYGRSWKTVESRIENNSAVVKVEVPVVIFTDDLEIKVNFESSDSFSVNIRSASRVGKSDLGENRRHVEQILKALDSQFSGRK